MFKLLLTVVLVLASFTPLVFADTAIAPPFTVKDAAGNNVSLPSRQPGVDVYLFWASWCPYCKALMPHLQSIQIEYGDDVRVYALQIRDDEDPVAFMEEYGYNFVLLPKADAVMEPYGVRSTPAVVLVGQNGRIHFNLYKMIFDDNEAYKALGHRQKSTRRAPHWAAAIRTGIDQIIAKQSTD